MTPTRLLLLTVPVVVSAAAAADPPVFTDRPTVLLLDTLQIVEGRFTRHPAGDYTDDKPAGVRTFPAKTVLFAGTSRAEVSDYLTRRATADAPPPSITATPAGWNPAAARAFPTRVQPVLTNLCAGCHAKREYAGPFKLVPVPAGYADPAGAAANLNVVLAAVNRADPAASDFLAKLVTRHGTQRQPALLVKTHPALAKMESWVHWAASPDGDREPPGVPRRPAVTAGRP